MNNILFWLPIVLGLLALAGLQIVLSNLKNPWPGRIMPILFFVASVVFTVFFTVIYSGKLWAYYALLFVCTNIPTFVFWIVYAVSRARFSKK